MAPRHAHVHWPVRNTCWAPEKNGAIGIPYFVAMNAVHRVIADSRYRFTHAYHNSSTRCDVETADAHMRAFRDAQRRGPPSEVRRAGDKARKHLITCLFNRFTMRASARHANLGHEHQLQRLRDYLREVNASLASTQPNRNYARTLNLLNQYIFPVRTARQPSQQNLERWNSFMDRVRQNGTAHRLSRQLRSTAQRPRQGRGQTVVLVRTIRRT